MRNWIWIGLGLLALAIIITIIVVKSNKNKEQAKKDLIPPPAPPLGTPTKKILIGGLQYISESKRATGTAFIRIAQGSEPDAGTIQKGELIIVEDAGDFSGKYKVSDIFIKDDKDAGIFINERTVSETHRPGGKIYMFR